MIYYMLSTMMGPFALWVLWFSKTWDAPSRLDRAIWLIGGLVAGAAATGFVISIH